MKFSLSFVALTFAVAFSTTEASSTGLVAAADGKNAVAPLNLRKLQEEEEENPDGEEEEEGGPGEEEEEEEEDEGPEEQEEGEMEMTYTAYGAVGSATVILSALGLAEWRRRVRNANEDLTYHLNEDAHAVV